MMFLTLNLGKKKIGKEEEKKNFSSGARKKQEKSEEKKFSSHNIKRKNVTSILKVLASS